MTSWLDREVHFLELLRTCGRTQGQALLSTIDKSQLRALSEIAHNVIKGTIVLDVNQKKKLKRYKRIITRLGKKKNSVKDRRRALEKGLAAVVLLLRIVGSSPWTK